MDDVEVAILPHELRGTRARLDVSVWPRVLMSLYPIPANGRAFAPEGRMWTGLEAFGGKVAWSALSALARYIIGRQIQIMSPAPQQTLEHRQFLGAGFSYEIRGRLKKLPRDHRIWLLREDERSGRVWPQGFSPVQFNPDTGEWVGRVTGSSGPIKIVAVVAPPTAHDLFQYYQKVGAKLQEHQQQYEPLDRIPVECINSNWVQARVP